MVKTWFVMIFQCYDSSMAPRIIQFPSNTKQIGGLIQKMIEDDYALVSMSCVTSERAPIMSSALEILGK